MLCRCILGVFWVCCSCGVGIIDVFFFLIDLTLPILLMWKIKRATSERGQTRGLALGGYLSRESYNTILSLLLRFER